MKKKNDFIKIVETFIEKSEEFVGTANELISCVQILHIAAVRIKEILTEKDEGDNNE